MKNTPKTISFRLLSFLMAAILAIISVDCFAATYYVSSSGGSDSNSGTSTTKPWKTLSKLNSVTYHAGDKIYLKSGDTWSESAVFASKFTGTAANPITFSSYGTGNRPKITSTTAGIILQITNADYLNVSNLDIGSGVGYGLVFSIDDSHVHGNIQVTNVNVHNMPNAGIFFNTTAYSNVTVNSCSGDSAEMMLAFSGGKNVTIKNSTATNCIYGGYSIIGINGGLMDNCSALNCGTGNYANGACGIFLGIDSNFVVRNCEVGYQKRQGTNPDGEAVDFERSNYNVRLVKCNFHNNDGCGIMFFDNENNLVNSQCKVDSCTFTNNSQNCNIPCGFEINFTKIGNNNGGSITNNIYTLPPGVDFITTVDSSVTVSNNLPPLVANAPAVADSGFEAPVVSTLQYQPTGTPWVYFGGAGIQHNGSAFGAPTAPEGSQTAFLQGASAVVQSLYFKQGTYRITFKSAYRSSSGSGQGIVVSVDGNPVGSIIYPASGTAFGTSQTDSIPLPAGMHIIRFTGSVTADKTAFIDQVHVNLLSTSVLADSIPLIANRGFENPPVGDYQYRAVGASWTIRQNAGVAVNGSTFGPPTAPSGTQVAFLQGISDISQNVYLNPGIYKVVFKSAYRNATGSGQGINVSLNGTQIGSTIYPVSGTAFGTSQTSTVSVTSGWKVLQFTSTYNGDKTAFIDSVGFVKVSGPSSSSLIPAALKDVLPDPVHLYPNPSNGVVNVDIKGSAGQNITAVFYNAQGLEVYRAKAVGAMRQTVDLHPGNGPAKLYIARFYVGNRVYARKLIVSN
ncbi:Por secretion system C-terminal sorting domain-containing protein [Mucilaginibacter gossypiicola]|uniref:Por secretion system C-terminal sorting domain-containing protein n=1 Tax=Mucilaginibacter gossypiicola TaxID=551995 RepID=A0A1H8BP08_9SPHI|nr:T9SS type A sorting domain-containing protein [Mucilaginibacter gossypiicola]SEM84533.1 Por secretion system C-terminal sorting domain-containing protein [Mucilaginibacter gossypiicola]